MSWIRKWKKNKKSYNWRYIHKACDKIAEELYEADIDCIVGLSRGGLIPAVILANNLGIREVFSIGVASYDQMQPGEISVYQNLPINNEQLIQSTKILVVDDISDKGNTFKHVTKFLREQYTADITTASIFTKPKTAFIPDLFYHQAPDRQWIVFPWELG